MSDEIDRDVWWTKHISLGNILTILTIVGGLFVGWNRMETTTAVEEVRIAALEAHQHASDIDHDLLIRIDQRLARIEVFAAGQLQRQSDPH